MSSYNENLCNLKLTKRAIVCLPFSTTSIWRYNYAISPFYYVFLDPFQDCWLSIKIVHRNIKKSLYLGSMKIHCYYVISTSNRQHVCNQFSRYWCPTLLKMDTRYRKCHKNKLRSICNIIFKKKKQFVYDHPLPAVYLFRRERRNQDADENYLEIGQKFKSTAK